MREYSLNGMLMLLSFLSYTLNVSLIMNTLPFSNGIRGLTMLLSLLDHVIVRFNASNLGLLIATRLLFLCCIAR